MLSRGEFTIKSIKTIGYIDFIDFILLKLGIVI